ncbi:MAG: glycoside hydrolase family 5 protein [Acidaminococcales bacterium]|jgi:endoglucanase|nr:glycoside hydrolase family 5 protein [Acidaminococcales bacterium]
MKLSLYVGSLLAVCLLFLRAVPGCCAEKGQVPPFHRGISIGNALDAPRGRPWDVKLKNSYFALIRQAGFGLVRLPARFSDYTGAPPDYKLDAAFMRKIDRHIKYALRAGLYVILDLHHFVEIMDEPYRHHARFLAIWRQLADRYRDYPAALIFEALNEPHGQLSGSLWNDYLADAVAIIRASNPERHIVVGADEFNSIAGLSRLILPPARNLILTFHYYAPIEFTLQKQEALGMDKSESVGWLGTDAELEYIKNSFSLVSQYAKERGLPVLLGEFGANEKAPPHMRKAWTAAVRRQAEQQGFAWAYWEFASIFGAYDTKAGEWRNFILSALID